jgi:hypothetical protein
MLTLFLPWEGGGRGHWSPSRIARPLYPRGQRGSERVIFIDRRLVGDGGAGLGLVDGVQSAP